MTTPEAEFVIANPDAEMSDEAIDALARLLLGADAYQPRTVEAAAA